MTLLELAAKLKLDDSEFNTKVDSAGSKFSALGNIAKVGMGVAAAAIGAASTAVGALAKAAVEGYAEFEQLEGGVKKLYGNMGQSLEEYAQSNGKTTAEVKDQWQALEDAQNQVLNDANEAYKTAGMSANQYMEIATSFSASLINSLGGDTMAAAEQTKVAMTAISDNVNTFGSNMEDVTNAFKGFSKQNYTMLDNLKLGYGGTKTEMERLIADANEWGAANGKASDLTIDSFSDVVTAIEQIQEKQNIAGTTLREGSITIEGSINQTKAAWENLVSSLGNSEADISSLVNNVLTSAENVFNNVLPIAQQALSGIGTFVVDMIPKLAEMLPGAITQLLPSVLSAATSLLSSVGQALPLLFNGLQSVVTTSISNLTSNVDLSSALSTGVEMVAKLGEGIQSNISSLLEHGAELVGRLAEGVANGLPKLLEQALPLLVGFSESLRENVGKIVDMGLELIVGLVQGLANSLPTLIAYVPTIITNICEIINENMPKILMAGVELIVILGKGILQAVPALLANFPQIVSMIFSIINAVNWLNLGSTIIKGITSGVKTLASNLPDAMKAIIEQVKKGFKDFDWKGLGKNIVEGIVKGVKAVGHLLKEAIVGIAHNAFSGVKEFFGIASPSKLMEKEIGAFIPPGIANGIINNEDVAIDAATSMAQSVADAATVSANADIGANASGVSGYGGMAGVTINVYGSEGQSAKEIAEKVADIINNNIYRQRAVFA